MAKKRLASVKRKDYMAHCWARAQQRHKTNGTAQQERTRANLATVKSGGLTPWQAACAARYERHLRAKELGQWEPAVRTSTGMIQRTDGKRTWWEDPGIKDRAHYLGVPVSELREDRRQSHRPQQSSYRRARAA